MPGHGAVSRFVADASGGPRGRPQRSNVSMTIMRPAQQGHDGRKSSGSFSSVRYPASFLTAKAPGFWTASGLRAPM